MTDASPSSFADDTRYQRVLLGIIMLAVTAFGTLMTLVTVSLDTMAEDLGSSRATVTWTISGLMLTMAVFTPLAGSLGDIWGHRKVLLAGLLGGAVTTALCGLAWDALSLIGFRVLFGIFAAAVNPNALSLMMHAYGPERRSTAVGWFQFAVTGAPTLGLIVGGPLIDWLGWRSIFFMFGAFSGMAFLVGMAWLRPIPRAEGRPLDLGGAFSLGFGVLGILVAVTRFASGGPLDPLGLVALAGGAACLFGFVTIERRLDVPMLKLEYFRRRNFTLPLVAGAAIQFAYMGGFVITPSLLQNKYLWSVGASALLMMPRPGVFSLASPVGGWLPGRIGYRLPIGLGALSMIVSMAMFAIASPMTDGLGIALVVVALALTGLAAGISQPAIGALTVDSVDEQDMGIANGMNQQVTFVGIVGGIQTMSVLLGDDPSGGRFATTYLVGLGVAAIGMLTAFVIREPR